MSNSTAPPQCPPGIDCTQDLGPSVIAIVAPFLAITILSVAARLYCRQLTGHKCTNSDYTLIVGLFFAAALSGVCLWGPRLGLGKHVTVVPLADLESLLVSLWVGQILYAISLSATKVSILLLFRSLFPTPGVNLVIKIIGALCIGWGIESALVGIFSCAPIQAFWDVTIKDFVCINTRMFYLINSSMGAVLDVAILVIPIKKVWGLKMSTQQKIIVSGMFLLGGFVCVISVIRLFHVVTMNIADPTYSLYDTYIWSALELNVAIISACLPTLRPLLVKLVPKSLAFGTIGRSTKPIYSNGGNLDTFRSRANRTADNFERLHDHQQKGVPLSITSKTAIVVTHEVEQETNVGAMKAHQAWDKRSANESL